MADIERRTQRYPTDLTDDLRETLNSIRYLARSDVGSRRMVPITTADISDSAGLQQVAAGTSAVVHSKNMLLHAVPLRIT